MSCQGVRVPPQSKMTAVTAEGGPTWAHPTTPVPPRSRSLVDAVHNPLLDDCTGQTGTMLGVVLRHPAVVGDVLVAEHLVAARVEDVGRSEHGVPPPDPDR